MKLFLSSDFGVVSTLINLLRKGYRISTLEGFCLMKESKAVIFHISTIGVRFITVIQTLAFDLANICIGTNEVFSWFMEHIILIFQGTTMGKCELRNFHLHAMFRDSPWSWSTYIKGL